MVGLEFSESINWQLISLGQWYQGNPLRTWPVLLSSAPPSVREDVKQQITSVIVGYGIEVNFTLVDTSYQAVKGAISSARTQGGSLSVFGSLYGSGGKLKPIRLIPGLKIGRADRPFFRLGTSRTSTYQPWQNIQTHDNSKSIIIRAQNTKVPQVLGTIITNISG